MQIGARGTGASRIVTVTLEHSVNLAVTSIGRDVAVAIVEAGAERESRVNRAAIGRKTARDCKATRSERCSDLRSAIIVVVVNAVLTVNPEAFELRVHHEVDHARNRVSTVNR